MNAPHFDPAALVDYMSKASKATAHNTAMRAAFKKLLTVVEEMAAVFEDDYEAPVPKTRAKRGTGKVAQKKAAAAGNKDGELFEGEASSLITEGASLVADGDTATTKKLRKVPAVSVDSTPIE